MNSCILMAQIVSEPELRSTQDQTSVSTMIVEFESTREGEAPGTLQVEGWGKLAEEMKNSHHSGDQIIVEGRLSMNVVEHNGYKEKKAKLVASKIYPMGMTSSPSYQQADNVVDFTSSPQPQPAYAETTTSVPEPPAAAPASSNEDWDEIPF
ncbi:MAG: single-stranded DNA-binding protein [Cyanobacteria bacterium J06638_38]